MSHVYPTIWATSFTTSGAVEPSSAPSVAKLQDADFGLQSPSPSAIPQNFHARFADPGSEIDRRLAHQHHGYSLQGSQDQVHGDFVQSASFETLHMHPPSPPKALASLAEYHPGADNESLNDIGDQHDNLRDTRDELIGSRARLRHHRKQLQEAREDTVAQVGKAFDLMQRYFLTRDMDVPPELAAQWSKVDALRDDLGVKEAEYEEAENRYNMEEWMYTRKETNFVDSLLDGAEEASTPTDLDANRSSADVTRLAFLPQLTSSVHSDLTPPISPVEIDNVPLVQPNARLVRQTDGQLTHELSTPLNSGTSLKLSEANLNQSYYQSDPLDDASSIVQRIDQWMLHCLDISSMQKLMLSNCVPKGDLDFDNWWQTIIHYWSFEDQIRPFFHTGDTASLDSFPSQTLSKSVGQYLFDSLGTGPPDTRPSSISPLLPEEKQIDPESSEFPATIKLRDLVDVPRHVHFLVRSQSAQRLPIPRTAMLRSLSAPGSSVSTSATERDNVHRGRSPSTSPFTANDHSIVPGGTSPAPASLTTTTADYIYKHFEVSDVHLYHVDQPILQSQSSNQLVSLGEIDTNGQSSQSGSELLKDKIPLTGHGQLVPADGETFRGQSRNQPLAAKYQTRYPFASFIRVRVKDPWNLPLLRLTPFPDLPVVAGKTCKTHNRLSEIPFVDLPDTPFRLPGPSRIQMSH